MINYDVPQHPEDYVHRIGRTGRAQASGDAFTIMVAEDRPHMSSIERFIGQQIPRLKLEGFTYTFSTVLDDKPGSPDAHANKVKAVRVHGGYYCGPARRKRR